MPEQIPDASRPVIPEGYGIPEGIEGTLPWSFVEEQMVLARNYWIATTKPDMSPHTVPGWGVWFEGRFYFEGSPDTRRGKNLAINPAVSIHLESGDRVVILEGNAFQVKAPDRELAMILANLFSEKYAPLGYQPEPDQWDEGGLYRMIPTKVFAWSRFPDDVTRWVL